MSLKRGHIDEFHEFLKLREQGKLPERLLYVRWRDMSKRQQEIILAQQERVNAQSSR